MDIRFLKASITRRAIISWPFKLSILRSLLDEHDFGTIYGIRLRNTNKIFQIIVEFRDKIYIVLSITNLNVRAIDKLLKIFESNNVMINISTNLKKAMESVGRRTVRANTDTTIQTTNVLLVLLCSLVIRTTHEEFLSVKSF